MSDLMSSWVAANGLPASTAFFIVAAVVIAAQMLPIPGLFLMIFGGALWSMILLNLGFLGILVEVVRGDIDPAWLVAPGAWYGVYYLCFAWNHLAARRESSRLRTANAQVRVAFDAGTEDLLIEGGDRRGPYPDGLLRNFALERVYSIDNSGSTRVHLLLPFKEANGLSRGYDLASAGIRSGGSFRDGSGLSTLSYPREPSRPVLRVVAHKEEVAKRSGCKVQEQAIDLRSEKGALLGRLVHARAGLLPAWPQPIIGGFLDSGTPKWRIVAGFRRRAAVLTGEGEARSPADLVAAALELPQVPPAERPEPDLEAVRAEVLAITSESFEAELDKLEQLIAAPETSKEPSFHLLHKQPDLILPLAERMIAAMERAPGSRGMAAIARLVALLPTGRLKDFQERLLRLYDGPLADKRAGSGDNLLARFGEFGPVALPVLMRGFGEGPRGPRVAEWTLKGLVLLGPEACEVAGERLLAIWHRPRERERSFEDRLLYLALLRVGLREEAGRVEQRYFGPWWLAAWDRIGPDTSGDWALRTYHEHHLLTRPQAA